MGESKIKFGDKIFIYGHFLQNIYEFNEFSYNSVMGYMTVGGYFVEPKEIDVPGASIPGFVADFLVDGQFTVATPFDQMEMVDVTEKLSLSLPLPSGTKVWMPVMSLFSSQLLV